MGVCWCCVCVGVCVCECVCVSVCLCRLLTAVCLSAQLADTVQARQAEETRQALCKKSQAEETSQAVSCSCSDRQAAASTTRQNSIAI